MIRFYRIAMTTALLGGLALPALAQTLPPLAPAPAQSDVTAPAAPDTAPAAKTAAVHPQKHHHVSQKHKTAAVKTAPKPAPTTK